MLIARLNEDDDDDNYYYSLIDRDLFASQWTQNTGRVTPKLMGFQDSSWNTSIAKFGDVSCIGF